jgi:predicted nucleic acid-binding protein
MRPILDCSLAAAWLLPDEWNDYGDRVLTQVTEFGALVPGNWRLEVANTLLMAQRRRRITAENRAEAIKLLGGLAIELDAETNVRAWSAISTLAERLGLTTYDAAYLELAQRARLPLATLDRDLERAAAKLGIPLAGR